MNNNTSDQFMLGKVMVSPSRNELEADGTTLSLQPKVMEVLHYLALHYDRVIPKEELVENLWPGRVVTHGSVQKSINLLRKSLAEIMGDSEVITHYSKKGYQLKIRPEFLQASPQASGPQGARVNSASNSPRSRSIGYRLGFALIAASVVGIAYLALNWSSVFLDKSHRVQFQEVIAYTSETGHEAAGEPHPDNRHLAYVRQLTKQDGSELAESQLVVRNAQDKDWQFASTTGEWVEHAWSPSGSSLLAIELIRDQGQPLTPDFSSRAPRLYNVHVFLLDLENNLVLEKHRLSQWQGAIDSGTWWDENTIELVARQGENAINRRFRYALQAQHLEMLESPEFVTNPLITRVHKRYTAMASLHNGAIRVDFLAEDQSRIASRQLKHRSIDLSWIPDGSGVLVHSRDDQALSVVYRDGELRELELPRKRQAETSHYRYSANGERIYFAEARPRTDIWWQTPGAGTEKVIENGYRNYSASFAPAGDKFAYVSVRNNLPQVWLWEKGQERQISRDTLSGEVEALSWTEDGENILYKSGARIYIYNSTRDQSSVLVDQAMDLQPLALNSAKDQMVVLKLAGEADNLWRIDLESGRERQLTFGSVGSAVEYRGDIYFDYAGQNGLWVLRAQSDQVEQIARQAEKNSKLLAASEHHIFYVTGGECRESDIFQMTFDGEQKSTYLARGEREIKTTSFHPKGGALYSHCELPEADILVLE